MTYQKISVPGYFHEGTDRSDLYNQIFISPPFGLSVLDIGCNAGFYALTSAQAGASRCLGVDNSARALNVAKEALRSLDLNNLVFLKANIFEIELDKYDVVLCLNFLHHISPEEKLLGLLNKIDAATLSTMFFTITPFNHSVPSDNVRVELNSKGLSKIRLNPGFFKELWPDYSVTHEVAKTYPNRILIKVVK